MLKNKITLFLVFAVVIGISVAAFFVAFKGVAQTQQNKDKKEVKIRDIQREKEKFEPTSIQEGVMTAKQKKHSKIFKGYKNRAKIKDLLTQKEDVEIYQPVGDIGVSASFNLDKYLQGLFCDADAVVIGTVKSKASQINEDGTFTFTDYEFDAEEVLKNNIAAPINPNNNITVTRTGGAVKLNGHVARAIDNRQLPLIQDEHYLLFLRFIPDTGGYSGLGSSRDDDSFQIIGNRLVQQVSKNPLPFDGREKVEVNGFMTQVRVAENATCINQGGVQ